jgi:predicted transcriptional regulator
MDIQLPTRIVLQLQEIARQQEREISDILQEAIAEYVERHTSETTFRAETQQVIEQHRWLLDELEQQ